MTSRNPRPRRGSRGPPAFYLELPRCRGPPSRTAAVSAILPDRGCPPPSCQTRLSSAKMAEDSRDTHAESDNMSSEGAGAGGGAAGGAVGQDPMAHWASGFDTLLLFLGLPSQVFVVLLLEALNSYRNFGLRFVQYNYFVNEFGLSDTETGSLLGIKSTLDVVFGISGSLATDALGVRKTALFALCMATVGRCLLAFGRSRSQLYLACLFFSPFGEAFLSVGLYKVALKRLTTPRIRPLAFAIQYATFNFAGALCDVFIDHLRHQDDVLWFGQVIGWAVVVRGPQFGKLWLDALQRIGQHAVVVPARSMQALTLSALLDRCSQASAFSW